MFYFELSCSLLFISLLLFTPFNPELKANIFLSDDRRQKKVFFLMSKQLGNNSEKTEILKIDLKLTKASELCK
jgi:hypothetical protein